MPPNREKNLTRQAKQMGQPVPDRILNKPILGTGLTLYYEAFWQLQNDRNQVGYVPWSVKMHYADRFQFDSYQTEALNIFITRLDECYTKWSNQHKGNSHGNPD